VQELIGDRVYDLVIKNNTTVFINQPGKKRPRRQRLRYESQVRCRKTTRFVSQDDIGW